MNDSSSLGIYINLHEEIVPFREVVQKWMTNAEQQLRDEEREKNSTKSSLKSKNSKASRASTTSSRTRALEAKAKEVELRTCKDYTTRSSGNCKKRSRKNKVDSLVCNCCCC